MMCEFSPMRQGLFLLSVACGFLTAGSIASAQVPSSQSFSPQRFSFQPVENGVMRLDTETGHVSYCTRSGIDYLCRSVADDRAALNEEIARLKRENESLRLAQVNKQTTTSPRLTLPSEEEIDKAMGLFEKMMRRMMRTFRDEPLQTDRL